MEPSCKATKLLQKNVALAFETEAEREAREKAEAEAAAREEEEARARARAADRRELAAEVLKMIESREKKASSSRHSKRQERRARKAARDLGALAKIHGIDRTTRRAMERLLSRKVLTHKTHCILDEESDAPEKEASTNTALVVATPRAARRG